MAMARGIQGKCHVAVVDLKPRLCSLLKQKLIWNYLIQRRIVYSFLAARVKIYQANFILFDVISLQN